MKAKHAPLTEQRCKLQFADGRRYALPAASGSGGLCYTHTHARHRRLRPSDLTRELTCSAGDTVPVGKLRRLYAKLPIALADGTISIAEFRTLNHLCSIMVQCSRLAADELSLDPRNPDWILDASHLRDEINADTKNEELPSSQAHR
jgi:hypothetical protein